jgi:hypothetical protein
MEDRGVVVSIPETFYTQAVKPRGNTVNERLNFLLNWYVTTGTKVAKDSTWSYQIEFNEVMAKWGNNLRPVLMRDTDEDTRNSITNFLPIVDDLRTSSRNSASISFFCYLTIELNKVINA